MVGGKVLSKRLICLDKLNALLASNVYPDYIKLSVGQRLV